MKARLNEEHSLVLLCCHIDRGRLSRQRDQSFQLDHQDLSDLDHLGYPGNLVDLRSRKKKKKSINRYYVNAFGTIV